ncbi:MAG: hypothetical protein Q8O53_03410 [Candidatus Moranbacteria bacterium]|nr:hypothetical protein [Candidatus Moranbacteria bacterium]
MREIWSQKIIIPALIIAILYVVATVYLMNASLVKDTLFGIQSTSYKWNILIALLGGMWTAMSGLSLFLLTTVAMLTGLNLVLTLERIRSIRSSGKMHLAIGGSSILGIVGSGCASCGLPILALLGFGGAAYLPFQGMELSLVAIAFLSVSLYVLVRGRTRQLLCVVEPMKYQKQYASVSE